MIKGYKGFNKKLACKGFKYEIGKTYTENDDIVLCVSGFHFCRNLQDIQGFYDLKESRICEIVASGKIIDASDGRKSVCSRIKIVRELSKEEITKLANNGELCTGLFNNGDCNSGDFNSGSCNSGNRNSGDFNSGNWNSGLHNSGDCNKSNKEKSNAFYF